MVVLEQDIAEIVTTVGRVDGEPGSLDPRANLFDLGMSSFHAVQVMLALEDRFQIQFPDEFLRKEHFATIQALGSAIQAIQGGASGTNGG